MNFLSVIPRCRLILSFKKKFCLFVCLFGFFVPLKNFSFIWRRHLCRWMASNFDPSSALMAIEHWGFFSVPHLRWHVASVYNGNLRGSVALAPTTERYVFDVVLTFGIFRTRMLNIILKFKRGVATPVAPSYPPPTPRSANECILHETKFERVYSNICARFYLNIETNKKHLFEIFAGILTHK